MFKLHIFNKDKVQLIFWLRRRHLSDSSLKWILICLHLLSVVLYIVLYIVQITRPVSSLLGFVSCEYLSILSEWVHFKSGFHQILLWNKLKFISVIYHSGGRFPREGMETWLLWNQIKEYLYHIYHHIYFIYTITSEFSVA